MSGAIDVALTLEELAHTPLAGVSAVMVDVVRASTTIVTALARGARAVVPVATPADAVARARGWPGGGALLGGERGGSPPAGFDCGNSPAEYTAERVGGRTVIFTTTNGTRALLALSGARRVAVAGFVNADAAARWLAHADGGALIVSAGESGRVCLEDATCAGLLVERLRVLRPDAPLTDGARVAALLWRHYRSDLDAMLEEATWAQVLAARGRAADLTLCTALDAFPVVPVARDGALVLPPRD